MSISSTRFSDPSNSYNPTQNIEETNKTSDIKDQQNSETRQPSVTELTDEAIKNLPSNQAAAEANKFLGNFQAYRLQQALSQPQQSKPEPTKQSTPTLIPPSSSSQPSATSVTKSNLAPSEVSEANALLFQHQTDGVSAKLAAGDNIPYGGVNASYKMAETDRKRVMTYRQEFIDVGKKYNLPPALLAGIASRESRGGNSLDKDGFSPSGNWFGLLQVNADNHTIKGKYNSIEHIDQAAGILSDYRDTIKKRFPDLSDAEVLRGAVAAYNRGEQKIQTKEAIFSNEYSGDIWARSQYYARNFEGGNKHPVDSSLTKEATSSISNGSTPEVTNGQTKPVTGPVMPQLKPANMANTPITSSKPTITDKPPTEEAKALIEANTSFFGNLDEEKLGSTLAKVAIQQPALVKEVFNQLSSRNQVEVSRGLVDELTRTNRLNITAATNNGSIVLNQISNILVQQGQGFGSLSYSKADLNRVEVVNQALSKAPMAKSQTIVSTSVSAPTSVSTSQANTTPRELAVNEIPKRGNPEIRFELPKQGDGYSTYNRNDTPKNYRPSDGVAPELQGKHMPDQIGTKDTIEHLETLAKEWNTIHPDRPLQIGDISLPGGGYTPAHHTHIDGRDVDVRPLRNDNKLGPLTITAKDYDQKLTGEFIQFVLKRYPNTTFYFNDSDIISKFPKAIEHKKKHNDHVHIIFSPKDDQK